jgi:four helix bundle protein
VATLERNSRRTVQPYERFQAWGAAHELALKIYECSKGWPTEEKYGLISQARRTAFSVAVNIVEGSARPGPNEFRRFLDISLASLAELAYILRIATDLKYLRAEQGTELEILRDHTHRLVWGLQRAVARRAKAAPALRPSA